MQGFQTIGSILFTLAARIPARWWAAVILGIPTSYAGVQWMCLKLIKQQTDCQTNISYDAKDLVLVNLNGLEKIVQNYSTCIRNVDPQIGTIQFIKDQQARMRSGRL